VTQLNLQVTSLLTLVLTVASGSRLIRTRSAHRYATSAHQSTFGDEVEDVYQYDEMVGGEGVTIDVRNNQFKKLTCIEEAISDALGDVIEGVIFQQLGRDGSSGLGSYDYLNFLQWVSAGPGAKVKIKVDDASQGKKVIYIRPLYPDVLTYKNFDPPAPLAGTVVSDRQIREFALMLLLDVIFENPDRNKLTEMKANPGNLMWHQRRLPGGNTDGSAIYAFDLLPIDNGFAASIAIPETAKWHRIDKVPPGTANAKKIQQMAIDGAQELETRLGTKFEALLNMFESAESMESFAKSVWEENAFWWRGMKVEDEPKPWTIMAEFWKTYGQRVAKNVARMSVDYVEFFEKEWKAQMKRKKFQENAVTDGAWATVEKMRNKVVKNARIVAKSKGLASAHIDDSQLLNDYDDDDYDDWKFDIAERREKVHQLFKKILHNHM